MKIISRHFDTQLTRLPNTDKLSEKSADILKITVHQSKQDAKGAKSAYAKLRCENSSKIPGFNDQALDV